LHVAIILTMKKRLSYSNMQSPCCGNNSNCSGDAERRIATLYGQWVCEATVKKRSSAIYGCSRFCLNLSAHFPVTRLVLRKHLNIHYVFSYPTSIKSSIVFYSPTHYA